MLTIYRNQIKLFRFYKQQLFIYVLGIAFSLFFSGKIFANNFIPEQPHINTNSFILVDYNSNRVLLEKNSEKRVEPASLTKIMTVYVIDHEIKSGRLSLNEDVTISKQAWQTSGSRMFVDVNSKVKVADLLRGIIIQSGNDASVAMAEHIAGSEEAFAGLMNEYAASLGMKNSHFTNSTGLPDPNHYTTAKDLAILAAASIREHPESYSLYSQKSFKYNNIEQNNRNKLLWRHSSVDGIKTGLTDNAGYCIAASGVQDNTRLIAVLLGSKTDEMRTTEASKLLTWGFRFFTSHKIYRVGNILETIRVWGGAHKTIDVGLANDVYLSLPKHDVKKVTTTLLIPHLIKAPLEKGTAIGTYVVRLKDEIIAEYPAVALHTVKNGHFFTRISDKIAMYFNFINKKMHTNRV